MASTAKRKKADDCRVQLGPDLIIGQAPRLHAQLVEALEQSGPVVLDAAAVTRLDTSGLQLLYAFVQARGEKSHACVWENVGDVLRAAAAQLGMLHMLKLPDPAAAIH